MFLCEECGTKKHDIDPFWYTLPMGISIGTCEGCNEHGRCLDYTGYKKKYEEASSKPKRSQVQTEVVDPKVESFVKRYGGRYEHT